MLDWRKRAVTTKDSLGYCENDRYGLRRVFYHNVEGYMLRRKIWVYVCGMYWLEMYGNLGCDAWFFSLAVQNRL
jgi:hypothetical protein